ncbi:MAG: hypothetical protein FWH02_03195 [Oscillospiraceae bacterium]|nr:hypothetical protein [Oscillospiraceae bacterium]
MKEYRICTIGDNDSPDALPVAKIIDYPKEERDYRPFAQNILCRGPSGYRLRMWAFEVSPPLGSELCAAVSPFADGSSLRICCIMEKDMARHHVTLLHGGEEILLADYTFRPYNGEDLQGVYWGGEFSFSDAVLEKIAGPLLKKQGEAFPGNFYKTCPDRHYGSFSPVDWNDPYGAGSMGRFVIVDY